MHDIRINKEQEKEIVRARFKISPIVIVTFVILAFNTLLFLIGWIVSLKESANDYHYSSSSYGDILFFSGVMSLTILLMFIAWMVGIKKSSCIVTNKRIYGVTSIFIAKKKYSYRLDEIDNVETVSSLGIHGLALNFSQGHGPQGIVRYNRGVTTVSGAGTFKITNIANIDEVYEKLSDLLTSVKNDKDLMVDIEMSKVQAENRKATAFENMASNMGGTTPTKTNNNPTYIEELKGLKELLDAGIISETEFEEKKKNLLK